MLTHDATPAPVEVQTDRPPVARPLPAAATVLGLQRSAGNQAVARFLQIGAAASTPGRRALSRFAINVTTTTDTNNDVVIDTVRIGSRPKGIFGDEDKSHTVSWETFCDGLRYEIIGQYPDVALRRIEALYVLTTNLATADRVGFLDQAPAAQALYEDAAAKADKQSTAAARIIAAPGNFNANAKVATVQDFAAAYLRLRNSLPLSAVDLANPSGGAELDVIRDHETGRRTALAAVLRAALWRHLDPRAVGQLAVESTAAAAAPGIDADQMNADDIKFERKQRVIDIIRDHLTTMRASYPTCFADANMGTSASVRAYLRDMVMLSSEGAGFKDSWVQPIAAAATGGAALPALPANVRAPGFGDQDDGKNFSVRAVTKAYMGLLMIKDVHVGGRPRGVFGTPPGSHTTAWIAYVDQVRAGMLNQSLPNAANALVALGNSIRDPDPARVAALGPKGTTVLQNAQAQFDTAVGLAAPASELERVQQLARAVLMLLNVQPLSASHSGGLANPAREGDHRAAIKLVDLPGQPVLPALTRWPVVDHLWGLLDVGVLRVMSDDAALRVDMPGSKRGETGAQRLIYAIDHHLTTVRQAYPHASARARIGDLDALIHLLANPTLRLEMLTVGAIANGLGHSRANARTLYENVLGSQAKKRRQSEDELPKAKRLKQFSDKHNELDFDPKAERHNARKPKKKKPAKKKHSLK